MANFVPTVRVKASHPSQGEFVEINADAFDPAKHERYVKAPVAAVLPPPPPPPPFDPLANLGKNWRDGDVKALAQTVTGRAAENKKQAIEMVEAALAARK